MTLAPPLVDHAPAPRSALPRRRQVATVVVAAIVAAALLKPITFNSYLELLSETVFVGLMLLFAFTAAGAWRQRWLPRRAMQFGAVALAAVASPLMVQLVTFRGDFSAFAGSRHHVIGYVLVAMVATLVGTVAAAGALRAERERARALQLDLERETLQRQVADARLALLTAQIQPHFLLNTLANVQELVESGSPQAVPVFRSLIEYLRACVPRLQQEDATLADEERLVRAYLEVMHMRMPDRLAFDVAIAPELRAMRFPPMALLTLVENAVRHGIDPAVEGGRIAVGAVREADGRAHLWVADTGVGLSGQAGEGLGLANLNARLRAFFGEGTRVELSEQSPSGVRADIRVPAPA